MLRLLTSRPSVRSLSAAIAVSGTGDWLLGLALPYVIFTRTRSPLAAGAMMFTLVLPRLLVGPVAGLLADISDRRRTMVLSLLASAGLVAGLVPATHIPGLLGLVYPVMFVQASSGQVFLTARQAAIPSLVESDRLHDANALVSAVEALSSLVGPPLGGVLLPVAGFDALVAIDVFSFLVGAGFILALPEMRTARAGGRQGGAGSGARAVGRRLSQGGLVLWQDPRLRMVTACGAIMALGGGAYYSLTIPFASGVLHLGPREISLAFTVFAATGIATSPLASRVLRWLPIDHLLAFGLVVKGGALMAMALLHAPPLFILSVAAFGAPNVVLLAASRSVVQLRVRPAVLGQVIGTVWAVLNASNALGAALASAAAQAVGPGVTLLVMGAGVLAAGTVVGLLSRSSVVDTVAPDAGGPPAVPARRGAGGGPAGGD